jgi:vitamin B12 transporter
LGLALASITALAATVAAQEPPDTFQLDELVVSATRLPTARRALPAAVTVLRRDELRALGAHRVVDALRLVPGVHLVSSGPTGSLTSLFLRGGESDYVQVLVDGVPVNEPGGAFDFAHLSTLEVDRIEVVRGPVGVLYGTDAVAGVVQIFTRSGSGAPTLRASVEGSTFEKVGLDPSGGPASGRGASLRAEAGLSGALAAVGYSLGVSRDASDGVLAANNDYENVSGSASLRWSAPWSTSTLTAGARSQAALTGRLTDHTYHYPTDGAGRIVDMNQHGTGRSLVVGLDGGHYLSPVVEARGALKLFRGETGFDDRPDTPADTLGSYASQSSGETRRGGLDVHFNAHLERAVVSAGAAAEWQSGSSAFTSQSQFGPFETSADYSRSNRAFYTQLVAQPSGRFTATAGGRFEDNETFGAFNTYRVGLNVRVTSRTTLRGSLGTAFKEPTFFENFAEGFVQGNAELEPERSRSAEVGASQDVGVGFVTVTLFDQRFRDLIQYDGRPRAQRPGDPSYYNLAEARSRGVEAEASVRPIERLDLTAGWTVLDTEVLDAGLGADRAFLAGERLLRRPAQSGSALAVVQITPSARASLAWRHVGRRDDLDFSSDFQGVRVKLPSHSTVDVGAELDVARLGRMGPLTLTARVRNALDESYQEVFGFPAAGRALFLGVSTGR